MELTIQMWHLVGVGVVGLIPAAIVWNSDISKVWNRVSCSALWLFVIVGIVGVGGMARHSCIERNKEIVVRAEREARVVEIENEKRSKRRETRRQKTTEDRAKRQAAEAIMWGEYDTLRDAVKDCKGNYELTRHTLQQFKLKYGCTNNPLTQMAYLELAKMTQTEMTLADNYIECVEVFSSKEEPQ